MTAARLALDDFSAGDAVVYVDHEGRREDGIVTSVGTRYVFVRFSSMHPAAPGKACRPEDLEWP